PAFSEGQLRRVLPLPVAFVKRPQRVFGLAELPFYGCDPTFHEGASLARLGLAPLRIEAIDHRDEFIGDGSCESRVASLHPQLDDPGLASVDPHLAAQSCDTEFKASAFAQAPNTQQLQKRPIGCRLASDAAGRRITCSQYLLDHRAGLDQVGIELR